MRLLASLVLSAAVLGFAPVPAAAQAEGEGEEAQVEEPQAADEEPERRVRRSCATLRKQIARYENVAEMAAERDDALWEQGTREHIERLRERQKVQCPQDVPPDPGKRFKEFMILAGKMALTAFSMGAF